MTNVSTGQATVVNGQVQSSRAAPAGVPISDVDPFSVEFFENPHRIHELLREAGPIVWLSR